MNFATFLCYPHEDFHIPELHGKNRPRAAFSFHPHGAMYAHGMVIHRVGVAIL
jgi:hypothetical protein